MEILDSDKPYQSVPKTRRQLLPWWIKFFSGLFLIAGVLSVIAIPASIAGLPVEFKVFGLEYSGILNWEGVACLSIFLVSGIVAYGLLWGKNWAVSAAIGLCIAEFLLAAVLFFVAMNKGYISFRLEYILVVPFFYKMFKIADDWEKAGVQ